jgi:hypothetical protein
MRHFCVTVLLLDAVLGLAAVAALFLRAAGRFDLALLETADPASPWAGARLAATVLAPAVFSANLLGLAFALHLVRDRSLRIPVESGEVSVAVSAVEQSLARTACALPDVRDVHVRVVKRAGDPAGLAIGAHFTAWEGTAVKETTQRLQEVLRLRARDIVGDEVPLEFDIRLSGIVLRETKTETKRRKDKDRPTYRGPVYPIDGAE